MVKDCPGAKLGAAAGWRLHVQTQLTETQHTLAQREAELSDLKVEVDRLKVRAACLSLVVVLQLLASSAREIRGNLTIT